MEKDFSVAAGAGTPLRSVYSRPCGYKTTMYSDELIPFFCDEVIPGDTFAVNATFLLRFNDLLRPFMDNLFFETFYFYVPYRLVWENWEKFCGAREKPTDTNDYVVPTIKIPRKGSGDHPKWLDLPGTDNHRISQNIYQYFGLPSFPGRDYEGDLEFNVLPLRAYKLIWNEWFRDVNLQDALQVDLGDSDVDQSGFGVHYNYSVLPICKKHDYFTSCLPWPQRGPSVMLPLGSSADIVANGNLSVNVGNVNNIPLKSYPSNPASTGYVIYDNTGGTTNPGSFQPVSYNSGLAVDLSSATASTINQLREAFAVQRMYEKDARGGCGRYTEVIQMHFGVSEDDLRLQRPLYLGGSSQKINVIAVPQTSAALNDSPQGNLAAYSVSGSSSGFFKSFRDYGVVIGLCAIRSDLNYQQGLDRMWSRRTRFDFYWPSLAFLGEQAVLNKEIYFDGSAEDDEVFGYQERWAEYRYKRSIITGELNSSQPEPMDQWHLAQYFSNRPLLNASFINSKTPIERVVAIKNKPFFMLDSYISNKCSRPMPTYSVPGLIDHF